MLKRRQRLRLQLRGRRSTALVKENSESIRGAVATERSWYKDPASGLEMATAGYRRVMLVNPLMAVMSKNGFLLRLADGQEWSLEAVDPLTSC